MNVWWASKIAGVAVLMSAIAVCVAIGLSIAPQRVSGWSAGFPQSGPSGGVHRELTRIAIERLQQQGWNMGGQSIDPSSEQWQRVINGSVVPDAVHLQADEWWEAVEQLELMLDNEHLINTTTHLCTDLNGCDYHECDARPPKHCGLGTCFARECENELCEALCADFDRLDAHHEASEATYWRNQAKQEVSENKLVQAQLHAGYATHFAADWMCPCHLEGQWNAQDLQCITPTSPPPWNTRQTVWETRHDESMLAKAGRLPGEACFNKDDLDAKWTSYRTQMENDWRNDTPSCSTIAYWGDGDAAHFDNRIKEALEQSSMLARYIVADVFDLTPPAYCAGGDSATVTDIPNPDAYTCSQAGYVDFEAFPDGTNLSSGTISGVQFTTTNGYTWVVGDFDTGQYNGKYPSGAYTSDGKHWAWLGVSQGSGRIDFPRGPASYFSLLVSDNTPVSLDAYDSGGHLLATAGPASTNIWTGHMAELRITRATRDMAYVVVHDAGDYFEIDDVCTNAPGTPDTIKRLVGQIYRMFTGDHVFGQFLVDMAASVRQYLRIFVGPVFSDIDVVLTRPDGSIVLPDDPGVTFNKTPNYVEILIDDAEPGEWQYEIVANQLEPGGENVQITVDQESIPFEGGPPELTVPGTQSAQYSDWLEFSVSATDPDDLPESLTFSATGLCDGLGLIDNLDGTASVEGAVQSPAGTCNAEITVTDPDGLTDTETVPIVVGKEDGTLGYSGDALVKKGSQVTLKASVSEVADGSPGDITKAAVFFDVTAGIGGGTTTYGPVSVSASGEAAMTLPTGLPANVYSVDVRMDPANGYYQASPADTAALVVYDPSVFTIGGGWVKHGDENGVFAFDARYSLRGDVRGFALYLFGLSRGGRPTLLMSNSTQWLVASGNTAVFRGKATVGGVRDHTFEITVVDNGEPGKSDTFAIKIWRPDGTLLHEMPPTVLAGGNIMVRQLTGRR